MEKSLLLQVLVAPEEAEPPIVYAGEVVPETDPESGEIDIKVVAEITTELPTINFILMALYLYWCTLASLDCGLGKCHRFHGWWSQ